MQHSPGGVFYSGKTDFFETIMDPDPISSSSSSIRSILYVCYGMKMEVRKNKGGKEFFSWSFIWIWEELSENNLCFPEAAITAWNPDACYCAASSENTTSISNNTCIFISLLWWHYPMLDQSIFFVCTAPGILTLKNKIIGPITINLCSCMFLSSQIRQMDWRYITRVGNIPLAQPVKTYWKLQK